MSSFMGRSMLRACLQLILLLLPLAGHAGGATILVVGDSISAGYGLAPGEGWVHLLEQRLEKILPAGRVINASVSGETTGGGLARLPQALEDHQPDVVMIALGGNDGLRGYPIDRIRDNLARMVSLSRAAEARVLLLGMRIPPNYGQRYARQFHQVYAALAERMGVALVPFLLEGIATSDELMQRDGIHPTAQAQSRLLGNVWPRLRTLLEAPEHERQARHALKSNG